MLRLPRARDIEAQLARLSLAEFVKQAWPILEPDTPLVWNWHIDVICEHIQALYEGRLGRRNLILNVPPGSLKSTIVSVCSPAWRWIEKPGWRGLFLAGSENIALRDSMKCRELLESPWYKESFRPQWTFAKDQNAKGLYKNSARGFRMALSAGSKIMGERAHGIFVDDPNDPEENSASKRKAVAYWWDNAASNRIANPKTGTRCIIQQRLAVDDLTGHVIAKNPDIWDHVKIRQEYEAPRFDDEPDDGRGTRSEPDQPTSLGWMDPRTKDGELLFPARFTPEVLAEEKTTLGINGYAGQHQQHPFAPGGVVFRKEFVQWYRPGSEPRFKRVIISFDTAFKEKEQNDYTVGLVFGEADAGFYLLHRWKERAKYPALRDKVKTMGDRWHPAAILIEDKASGQSLIQDLVSSTTLPVLPIQVDRDKIARAENAAPTWESRSIFLPEGADWVDDFTENLYGFPNMPHDDDVDAFTQAVNWLQGGPAPFNISDEAIRRF